ncbi:DUF3823 domain-containing protein [Dysgonomonas sp. ZJ279]|uniref:DUF3823 domain-containing protein n=1 Tax=Dysgonomonas sp. ZJ279 TaxID=2709796 RepID=UPI0013ECC13B|nr:DUF3823 domain-containing protein [Dysgonomonas sp. ZJ279]
MKKKYFSILILFAFVFSSCEKDNYDEPKSDLKGRVVTNTGETLGVRGTENALQMQLWQDGYDNYESIEVYINQDGTFAAKVFDGQYKLVTRDNNGPWVNDRDTLLVTVKGSTSVEYIVKPYFTLSNEVFKVTDNILTATFDVSQFTAVADRNIERITLYVGKTVFVDDSFKDKTQNAETPVIGSNTISMDISSINHPVLYARIGIRISGVDQMLYTVGSAKVK